MRLEDLLAHVEMAPKDFPMESIIPKVGPIEESTLMFDHRLIMEVTDRVISFITGGLAGLKDVLVV